MQNPNQQMAKYKNSPIFINWGASSRWSFGPNSACGSKETTTIGKTHPTLEFGHSLAVKMHLDKIDKDELPGVSMWTF